MRKSRDNVNIGVDALILPGVVNEDDVFMGANSLVPKGAHLERGGVYGSLPLQKIRQSSDNQSAN